MNPDRRCSKLWDVVLPSEGPFLFEMWLKENCEEIASVLPGGLPIAKALQAFRPSSFVKPMLVQISFVLERDHHVFLS